MPVRDQHAYTNESTGTYDYASRSDKLAAIH
jgi:hypothetical protein